MEDLLTQAIEFPAHDRSPEMQHTIRVHLNTVRPVGPASLAFLTPLSTIVSIQQTQFKDLPADIIDKLQLAVGIERFTRITHLFRQGDAGTKYYMIYRGGVRIFSEAGSDDPLDIVLHEGSHFGEIALLSNKTRSTSAETQSDTVLLTISKADYNTILLDFHKEQFEQKTQALRRNRNVDSVYSTHMQRLKLRTKLSKWSWHTLPANTRLDFLTWSHHGRRTRHRWIFLQVVGDCVVVPKTDLEVAEDEEEEHDGGSIGSFPPHHPHDGGVAAGANPPCAGHAETRPNPCKKCDILLQLHPGQFIGIAEALGHTRTRCHVQTAGAQCKFLVMGALDFRRYMDKDLLDILSAEAELMVRNTQLAVHCVCRFHVPAVASCCSRTLCFAACG
jgi:CRP-like cAMP-binding protein